jgi:hypothetical protein
MNRKPEINIWIRGLPPSSPPLQGIFGFLIHSTAIRIQKVHSIETPSTDKVIGELVAVTARMANANVCAFCQQQANTSQQQRVTAR